MMTTTMMVVAKAHTCLCYAISLQIAVRVRHEAGNALHLVAHPCHTQQLLKISLDGTQTDPLPRLQQYSMVSPNALVAVHTTLNIADVRSS